MIAREVTDDEMVQHGFATLGEWKGHTTIRCAIAGCNWSQTKVDWDEQRCVRHWAENHDEDDLPEGLTEPPVPVKVKTSLVDEHGKPLFIEE